MRLVLIHFEILKLITSFLTVVIFQLKSILVINKLY